MFNLSETMQASKTTRVVDVYGESRSKYSKTIYQWTIHNFSLLNEAQSPIFSSKGCNDTVKWLLTALWRSEYFELYITQKSMDCVIGNVKFLILNGNSEIEPIPSPELFKFHKDYRWGHKNFIKHDTLLEHSNGYLPDDKLTIICEVCALVDVTSININNDEVIEVPKCNLKDDLCNLLEREQLCDVILEVGEFEYKAHKAILAMRSTVFAAMFQHEMVERTQNRVVITDMEPLVLKEILYFIYTGKLPNIKQTPQEFLAAANKYDLKNLKAFCEKEFSSYLSVNNAIEIFAFADLHSADQLKTATLQFIDRNKSGVINSVGWKNLIASTNMDLIQKVLTSLNFT